MKKINTIKQPFIFLSITFLSIGFISCKKHFNDTILSSGEASVTNYTYTTQGRNFGVLINAAHQYANSTYMDSIYPLADANKIELARLYGVKYYRLTVVDIGQWDNASKQSAFLSSYKKFADSGFSILLNIEYANHTNAPVKFADSADYRNFLSAVLDSVAYAPPALVVVENEENNINYFINGTMTDYGRYFKLLNGAVEGCHKRGLKVTNGGIMGATLIPVTWDWMKTNHPADTNLTNGFVQRGFPPSKAAAMLKSLPASPYMLLAKNLINMYAAINIDYINIHWYEPIVLQQWNDAVDGSSSGINQTLVIPGVLDSVISYLNAKFTIPVLTNETGQLTSSADLTNSIMNRYLLYQSTTSNFPVVCWYDGDGQDQYKPYAFHNSYGTIVTKPAPVHYVDTYSLRNAGIAFKTGLQ